MTILLTLLLQGSEADEAIHTFIFVLDCFGESMICLAMTEFLPLDSCNESQFVEFAKETARSNNRSNGGIYKIQGFGAEVS